MVSAEIQESIKHERVLEGLRGKLRTLNMAAGGKKEAQAVYDEIASTVKPDLLEVDGTNGVGVRFLDHEGNERAAILSQPSPELSWDVSKLVPVLRDRGVWDKVSTRVLDPHKLASEIAAGTISFTDEELGDLQIITKQISPSVRFVNSKPESK